MVKAVYREPSVSFCQLQTQRGHGSSVSHWARKPTRSSEPAALFPRRLVLPACLCCYFQLAALTTSDLVGPPWEGGLHGSEAELGSLGCLDSRP